MLVLKQAEFGTKNKGGGKKKVNLASNRSRQRFAQEAAEKEAARQAEIAQSKTLKGRVAKAAKAVVETAKANKKTAIATGIAAGTVAGAVAVKKVKDKKKEKNFSEVGRLKLFSTAKDVAEDASTATALGATGALGYTGYQAAKGLKATADSTGNKILSKANIKAANVNATSKASTERVAQLAKSQSAKIANKANAINAFRNAGKGTKIAAGAAAASIVAGGASKLLGKKKEN